MSSSGPPHLDRVSKKDGERRVRDREATERLPAAATATGESRLGSFIDLRSPKPSQIVRSIHMPERAFSKGGQDDATHLLPQDQTRCDGLAEADVVGDEEIDSRKTERLAQGIELVGRDLDAGGGTTSSMRYLRVRTRAIWPG